MYSNVLYENSSGVNSGTITLSDTYDSYDFLEFYYKPSNWGTYFTHCVSVNDIKFSPSILLYGHQDKIISLIPDSTTQLRFGDINSFVLYKIIGYKMAKGGYSGIVSDARMTVKSGSVEFSSVLTSDTGSSVNITFDSPMPDANYIVSLCNITGGYYWPELNPRVENKTANGFDIIVWNTGNGTTQNKPKFDWIAIRPNSYTREGMVEDVLFSNASGVNSGTIILSGNISDYDLISIDVGHQSRNRNAQVYLTSYVLQSSGEDATTKIITTRYADSYVTWYRSSDNIININEVGNGCLVYKITGIKFGRYVSGVAVDTTVTQNSDAVVTSGAVYTALQNIPSGGGGGGSITIDSVPTENSQNAVSSGGVYDALQNLPSGGGSIDVYDLKTPVINGYNIKSANSEYYVAEKGKFICKDAAYTYTDIPALHAAYKLNNYYMSPILICPIQDGAKFAGSVNGSETYNANTYQTYYDNERGITWYCAVEIQNKWNWGSALSSAVENNTPLLEDCYDWLSACKKLIQLAEPVIEVRTIEENLFSPTNFTISSGDTISSDTLKALIAYPRPIVVNNETYYFVKKENGTSYYENPNNTIEVSSSWVVTITAKSSGGSSITVDSTITQGGTNPVEGGAIYTALDNKADKSTTYTKTEVDTALTSKGDVTTNTDQNITGTKTFVGSKKVAFKQSTTNDKLGFTLFGNTGTERGYLEFNPTNTIDGVAGLMTLGNYATSAGALTHVGFRRYSNVSGANGAYNLLTPLIADAKTPFSLTTTYTNFYLPLGFTDGTTTVRTAKSGLVDLSPLLASLEARIAALEGN